MSGLSEVTLLFGQRAGDLGKARDVFIQETRGFVESVMGELRRARSEPWVNGRVKIELPREIESDTRSADLNAYFALGRPELRFKKKVVYTLVAEVRYGIEFDQTGDCFIWQITLVPEAKYQRLDDVVWPQWKTSPLAGQLPGNARQEKANTIRFISRPLDESLTALVAFNDVKQVLEFLLTVGAALAEAVGFEPDPTDAVV